MTDEEIKKIAVAYSVSRPVDEMPTNPSMARMIVADALRWLSKDYCIVLKEKLDALQDEIHGEIMCAHDDDDWQSVAHYILDVMPRSFNDIFGKDMFKEDKI